MFHPMRTRDQNKNSDKCETNFILTLFAGNVTEEGFVQVLEFWENSSSLKWKTPDLEWVLELLHLRKAIEKSWKFEIWV